jgi:hypothetical protein
LYYKWYQNLVQALKGLLLSQYKRNRRFERRFKMKNAEEKTGLTDEIIKKTNEQIEQEKERNFVNLIAEIIVSVTLREYYEKGD